MGLSKMNEPQRLRVTYRVLPITARITDHALIKYALKVDFGTVEDLLPLTISP